MQDQQKAIAELFNDFFGPYPDLYVNAKFLSQAEHDILFDYLVHQIAWETKHASFSGQMVAIPRQIAWFGDVDYSYSGLQHKAMPMPGIIAQLRDKVEQELRANGVQASFNSVLMNYYRDGNDSIGMHSDVEKQLGANPTIASVTFGETRTFKFENKETRQKLSTQLKAGTLLVMKGATQAEWLHGIPKENNKTARINLTFRQTQF